MSFLTLLAAIEWNDNWVIFCVSSYAHADKNLGSISLKHVNHSHRHGNSGVQSNPKIILLKTLIRLAV